jgi:hypothetical protein
VTAPGVDPRRPTERAGALLPALSELTAFCQASYPDHYAALHVTEDQEGIVVYRRPGSDLDAALRRRFPAVRVDGFRDARYSERELLGLAERIVADLDAWERRGVRIYTVGPEVHGDGVEVATPDVDRARELLGGRYGPAVLVRRQDDPPVLLPPAVG